jgi:hypothetical protein
MSTITRKSEPTVAEFEIITRPRTITDSCFLFRNRTEKREGGTNRLSENMMKGGTGLGTSPQIPVESWLGDGTSSPLSTSTFRSFRLNSCSSAHENV